jgi:hypothetical protein
VSWEPTEEARDHVFNAWFGPEPFGPKRVLKLIHANPSLAGLDAPKLPTRSELYKVWGLPETIEEQSIAVDYADKMIEAGLATGNEPYAPESIQLRERTPEEQQMYLIGKYVELEHRLRALEQKP